MIMPRKIRHVLNDGVLYGVLILVCIFMILPFFWMLSTSLKPEEEIFRLPPVIISENSNLDAYRELIFDRDILKIVGNTLFVATASTALRLFFCSLAGYGFAKFKFPGRGALFAFLLGTMVIPFTVLMVPLFILMMRFGWINTFYALIIPGAASAFGIFFMRQYISTINDELMDAARIDGATEFGIYWRVILPIVAPGLTSLGLIFFMQTWNDYLWPLINLRSPDLFTLPLAIRQMVHAGIARPVFHLQMATSVISIIPLLIIFLVFQRRFVEGITAGAIK
jgi:ABC-type glycerol-3-phosphate transport system permease component